MKILITGATGFIGGTLAERFLEMGFSVRLLVRSKDAAELWSKRGAEIVRGDITNPDDCKKACEGVHSVFHLAGLVGYSKAMYQKMVMVNVVGTQNLVDAALENKVQKFIHMSSVTAIGGSFDGKHPLTEDSEFNLSHLQLGYFETKRKAEEIVMEAAKTGKIFALCLNPSTVYGPGDAEKGSRKTQLKVAKGKFPFYTSGGVNVIHVDDVVNAMFKAWESGKSGERYILAGENITIKELFKTIAKAAGVPAPYIYLPNPVVHLIGKVGDALEAKGKKGPINSENAWTSTMFHWFDSTKAQRELGLKPRPAKEAIQDSVKWIKDNGLA